MLELKLIHTSKLGPNCAENDKKKIILMPLFHVTFCSFYE